MRTIVQNGNPVLRATMREISIDEIVGKTIQDLITDMKELLANEKFGVAIAAPQVGEPLRLFVVAGKALIERKRKANKLPFDATQGKGHEESEEMDFGDLPPEDQVYINPVLVKMSRRKTDKHEGCLSVRGKWGIVPRAEKATVRACNEKGEQFTRGASGFLAHIFQHELDHLEGILYIDKATEVYDEKEDAENI